MRTPALHTACLLGAAALLSVSPAALAAAAAKTDVAFVSLRAGDAHIFVRDADGKEHQLTQGRTVNLQPTLSSAGKVAFVRLHDGRSSVYVADDPASPARKLTPADSGTVETAPSWAPDGSAIAYFSLEPATGAKRLMIQDLRANTLLSVPAPGDSLGPARPDWSADGQTIAFIGTDGDRRHQVWILSRNGQNLREVSSKTSRRGAAFFSLSPDGRSVAWIARERGRLPLMVTDLDSGETRDVLAPHGGLSAEAPRWSPDGQWIAFAGSGLNPSDPRTEVFVVKADGSGLTNVSAHAGDDFDPRWTPEGRHIVFASLRSGTSLLYEVPIAGGETRSLAQHASHDMDHITRPALPR